MNTRQKVRSLLSSVIALGLAMPLVGITTTITVAKADAPTLVINEINWAGSSLSPADQWVELYNNAPTAIDFSQQPYTLFNGTNPLVTLNSGMIVSHGFYLISRQLPG